MEKKKLKLWQIIVIIAVIFVLALYIAFIAKKVMIVVDLQNKFSKYENSDNYTIKKLWYQGDFMTKTEISHKGTKEKQKIRKIAQEDSVVMEQYINNGISNIYTEYNGQKTASLNQEPTGIEDILPPLKTDNFMQTLINCIKADIREENVNGKYCYRITGFVSPYMLYSVDGADVFYIEKSTGLLVRHIEGETQYGDDKKFMPIKDFFYEFDKLEDWEFNEPAISDYVVQGG